MQEKLKILQINKFFYRKGGAEVVFLGLRDLLKKHGHEVIDFSMHHPDNFESKYSDYFVHQVDFNTKKGVIDSIKTAKKVISYKEAAHKLEELIKKTQPDIAHIHNFNYQLTPSILEVLKRYNIPVVWTLHDYKRMCPNYKLFTQGSACERCKTHKYYNCIRYNCMDGLGKSVTAAAESYFHWLRQSYSAISHYIVPSQFMGDKLAEWEIVDAPVSHIYNYIDAQAITPDYTPGEYVLFVGRLSKEKGVRDILTAAKRTPHIPYKIVGTGPLEGELKDYAKKLDLKNVEFLGYKEKEEVYTLIRGAAFMLIPSVWYENNPLSLLEAFAFGKPVIGTRMGGIPELIKGNIHGTLVNPNKPEELSQAIDSLYKQPHEIERMGKAARQFVEQNMNEQLFYKKHLEVYEEVIRNK